MAPAAQLVVVSEAADSPLASIARRWDATGVACVVTTEQAEAFAAAGFELFAGRVASGKPTAYLCRDFVCRLPLSDADELAVELATL